MTCWHKDKTSRVEAKVKAHADAAAAIKETNAGLPDRKWRQRRPAAIIICVTPRHPRWCPHGVRPPAPAEARITKPASVMKRRVPGIVGFPIPAAVGVNPMATVAIGLPIAVIDGNRRSPATAVTGDVHPTAIRRERCVKIIHRDRPGISRWCYVSCVIGIRWWWSLRGWRGGHLLLQHLIALHHRGGDFVRHADIAQINNFIRVEIKCAAGIADVRENNTHFHVRLHQPDDIRQRTRRCDKWRQCVGIGS